MWRWTAVLKLLDEPQYLTLTFTAGDITAIDGVSMTQPKLSRP